MRRREFIALVGGAAAAWPLVARAQQAAKQPRLAMLSPGRSEPPDTTLTLLDSFEQGLYELGYAPEQNISIERQYAEWNSDRLRELATELVGRNVDVIAAFSTPAAPAARRRNCLRGSFTVMLHELEHLPGHNHIQRPSGCLLLTQSDRKCASTGFEGT